MERDANCIAYLIHFMGNDPVWRHEHCCSDHANIKLTAEDERIAAIGGLMEHEAAMLQAANEELERSKDLIRAGTATVKQVAEVVLPMLSEQVEKIRAVRMTITRETTLTIEALKEVANFFEYGQYQKQMERIKDFAALCHVLKHLKDDGTLEALSETIFRLVDVQHKAESGAQHERE
jgi:hypothetical protein